MRLLIDNQLPIALARYLETLGWTAVHVSEVGLESATDAAIWNYAIDNKFIIVSKDQDFLGLANAQRKIPPQFVWVRLGNCRRNVLFDAFARHSTELRRKLAAGTPVVEVR